MDKEISGRLVRMKYVFILSSYRIIRESLKILIEKNCGMLIAGEFNLAEIPFSVEALARIETLVIYLTEEDSPYVESISDLLIVAPHLRIVVITSANDSSSQLRAIELGAVGIVNKEQSSRVLIEAIRQIHSGETWIKQGLLTELLKKRTNRNTIPKNWDLITANSLTQREKEVVHMIGRGLKNKEIADLLLIKEATVRHHLTSIYGKLNVTDRLNLVIYAYQYKICESIVEI